MEENILLIKAVEKYPCLYIGDKSVYYMEGGTAWYKVAAEIKRDVEYCMKKWSNLRSGLRRSLNPKPGEQKKKYYLHDVMTFVIPFLKENRPFDNIDEKDTIPEMQQKPLPMQDDVDKGYAFEEPEQNFNLGIHELLKSVSPIQNVQPQSIESADKVQASLNLESPTQNTGPQCN